MINEERTLKDFGYTSDTIPNNSCDRVWVMCPKCGRERKLQMRSYTQYDEHVSCRSCANSKENHPGYGKHHSEETKLKMSNAQLGDKNHNFGNTGSKNPIYGRKHSQVAKDKMSVTNTGRTRTEISKARQSESTSGTKNHFYGKHHTEDSKRKISENHVYKTGKDHSSWLGGKNTVAYPVEFNDKFKLTIRMNNSNCDFLTGVDCHDCNVDRQLSVHHIDYDKMNINIENLIPLSSSNHAQTNTDREFWETLFNEMLYIDNDIPKLNVLLDIKSNILLS